MKKILALAALLALPACAGGHAALLPAQQREAASTAVSGGSTGGAHDAGCSAGVPLSDGPFQYNAGDVPAGDTLWISAVASFTGIDSSVKTTVVFRNVTYTSHNTDGTVATVAMPSAQIVFDPAATTASVTYGAGGWTETLPTSTHGDVFLDGLAYSTASQYRPRNGTIAGTVCSDRSGVSLQWKFGAALYGAFGSYASAGVKPTSAALPGNADHAGTPENDKSVFIGGAGSGGGGSNWTGSYSATASASLPQSTIASQCAAAGGQNAYIAYGDHVDVYPAAGSGTGCLLRTIALQGTTNAEGIAVSGTTLYALLRANAGSYFSVVATFDAGANGTTGAQSFTYVRNDGSGGLAYAGALGAVFETGRDAYRGVTQSVPAPGAFNGSPLQQRFFTGPAGAPLAVAADGTVYEAQGAGVVAYAPSVVDHSAPPDPAFVAAQPVVSLGDSTSANVAQAIALGADGTLYVASAPASSPQSSTIAVFATPLAAAGAPLRTFAAGGAVTSLAVDAAGELLVLHGAALDAYPAGASTPARSIAVNPTTAGPSALAVY